MQAFLAEVLKNRHSRIIRITFIAFSLAPVFGGVFMFLMKGNGYDGLSGAFKSKAVLMSFEANWNSYLGLLSQAVGVGGVLIFGFVASWLFGREYTDGTAKDLLALPISRAKIIHAKFIYYIIWCFLLVISNLLLGLFIGKILDLTGWSMADFFLNLKIYFITTILIVILNTPVAFLAILRERLSDSTGIRCNCIGTGSDNRGDGVGNLFPLGNPRHIQRKRWERYEKRADGFELYNLNSYRHCGVCRYNLVVEKR